MESMYRIAYDNQNELYHHGIKGMRWGVRRYQNKDGSLTRAGRKRYGMASGYSNEELEAYNRRARLEKDYVTKSVKRPNNNSQVLNIVGNTATAGAAGLAVYELIGSKKSKNKEKFDAGADTRKKIKTALTAVGAASKAAGKVVENRGKGSIARQEREYSRIAKSMSNDELSAAIKRLDLESNYNSLNRDRVKMGKRAVGDAIDQFGNTLKFTSASILAAEAVKNIFEKEEKKKK